MGLKNKMADSMMKKMGSLASERLGKVLESIHTYLELQTAYQEHMLIIKLQEKGMSLDEAKTKIKTIREGICEETTPDNPANTQSRD